MASGIRLQVCGPLAIEYAGTVILERQLPGRQARRLWAYLVLNRRRPVPRDELATAIWGDAIPDAWDASLNAIVSRLRGVLGRLGAASDGLAIRGSGGRYTLELPDEAFIDFERGWRALLRAESALRERDYPACVAEALIARGIAARSFLPGEDAPWIEVQRRVLADTLVQATELSGEAELARGAASDAQRLAREVVDLDALRESGYRLLMRSLAASGNGAQASRVMEECRSALRELAGARPSAETERVFREVTATAV